MAVDLEYCDTYGIHDSNLILALLQVSTMHNDYIVDVLVLREQATKVL